jgi:hypothetical protein
MRFQGRTRGIWTVTVVPIPGDDWIASRPPSRSARPRMLAIPWRSDWFSEQVPSRPRIEFDGFQIGRRRARPPDSAADQEVIGVLANASTDAREVVPSWIDGPHDIAERIDKAPRAVSNFEEPARRLFAQRSGLATRDLALDRNARQAPTDVVVQIGSDSHPHPLHSKQLSDAHPVQRVRPGGHENRRQREKPRALPEWRKDRERDRGWLLSDAAIGCDGPDYEAVVPW